MYPKCNTCKEYGSCGCDDWRERAYLHNEGKDCHRPNPDVYVQEENVKTAKIPSNAQIYEAEDAWERRVSSYGYY